MNVTEAMRIARGFVETLNDEAQALRDQAKVGEASEKERQALAVYVLYTTIERVRSAVD